MDRRGTDPGVVQGRSQRCRGHCDLDDQAAAGHRRGQVPLRVQAAYTAGQQRVVTYATAEVQTFYPTLAAAMHNRRKPSRRRR